MNNYQADEVVALLRQINDRLMRIETKLAEIQTTQRMPGGLKVIVPEEK